MFTSNQPLVSESPDFSSEFLFHQSKVKPIFPLSPTGRAAVDRARGQPRQRQLRGVCEDSHERIGQRRRRHHRTLLLQHQTRE